MSKHSPGPWKVCNSPLCKHGHVIDSDGEDVCVGAGDNASLIASAPTLAAKLDEAIRLLHLWPCDDEGYPLHPDVRAFLAAIDAESSGGTR